MEHKQTTAPFDCVVVANGLFPETPALLELLHTISPAIACDGAALALHGRGVTPLAIIGDLDSLPTHLRLLYADRIHHVSDQNSNDFTKAIRFAHQQGFRRILVLGATGLREDHALANISLLVDHAPLFERIEIYSDYGRFIPLLHSATLDCVPGQQVSLFSASLHGTISTQGLRWALQERHLTAWWQGTLNEATGDSFTITLSEEARAIVYLAHSR